MIRWVYTKSWKENLISVHIGPVTSILHEACIKAGVSDKGNLYET